MGILKRTSTDEAAEEAVVAGRLAAGRLVLDRLGRLYDLFADFVSDALESLLELLGISAWHAHEKCRADD